MLGHIDTIMQSTHNRFGCIQQFILIQFDEVLATQGAQSLIYLRAESGQFDGLQFFVLFGRVHYNVHAGENRYTSPRGFT